MSKEDECYTSGCKVAATLSCPVCLQLGEDSRFCCQECFRSNYSEHKGRHAEIRRLKAATPVEDDEIPIAEMREGGMEINCEHCAWVLKHNDHANSAEFAQMLADGRISPEVCLSPAVLIYFRLTLFVWQDACSMLSAALCHSLLPLVRSLLVAKVHLETKDDGRTTLMTAAQKGSAAICSELVRSNVAVDTQMYDGQTALHMAACRGNVNVCSMLLNCMAAIDAQATCGGRPLLPAAQNGHLRVCDLLLARRAFVNAVDFKGRSALHKAAAGGHADICSLLIENRACWNLSMEDLDNGSRWTPLKSAIQEDRSEVCLLLLSGPDRTLSPEEFGFAIQCYSKEGSLYDLSTIRILLNHADVDVDGCCWPCGCSSLHKAAFGDQKQNFVGQPLPLKATELCRLLLEHKADVDCRGGCCEPGYTLLHLSAIRGKPDLCMLLLEHKANVALETSADGEVTALDIALTLTHFAKKKSAANKSSAMKTAADETVVAYFHQVAALLRSASHTSAVHGDRLVYVAHGEAVTVVDTHLEDPNGVYYTVTTSDGQQKQLTSDRVVAEQRESAADEQSQPAADEQSESAVVEQSESAAAEQKNHLAAAEQSQPAAAEDHQLVERIDSTVDLVTGPDGTLICGLCGLPGCGCKEATTNADTQWIYELPSPPHAEIAVTTNSMNTSTTSRKEQAAPAPIGAGGVGRNRCNRANCGPGCHVA